MTGTPPAANPQSIATHDNVAQSEIEQGADLEQGSVQPAEGEGPQIEEVDQQSSAFTSSAFDRLPKPLPVEDIFFNGWWLIAVRIVVRSLVIYLTWYSILGSLYGVFPVVLLLLTSRYILLKVGYTTVSGFSIPSKTRLLLGLFLWIKKFWEHVSAQALLHSESPAAFVWIWWYCYLLISDMADFKQNYMEAWRQRHERSIRISVRDEFLMIPIPHDVNDEALLRRLRMFYRMIKVEQGIPGLLLPRKLERIDCVKISIDPLILLDRTETLQLGRYKGRLVSLFRSPQLGKNSSAIANKIQSLPHETALEFKQTYDLHVISLVLAAPPIGSVIFAVAWISIFVNKQGVDLQNLIGSAFTTASYIITTGALIIAFVAFLDQKKAQNEEMIDRFGRRDTLEQNGVPNNTMHNEDSLNLDASAPQASSTQNQPVVGTSNLNPDASAPQASSTQNQPVAGTSNLNPDASAPQASSTQNLPVAGTNPFGESAEQRFTQSRSQSL